MSWLQIRLAITPDQAEALEDQLLQLGAVSVTFMDAEDQPIFEPDLNTTPLWSHTHLLALFEADTDPDALLAHLQLLRGGDLPEHQTEVIEDQDWERSWMDNFQPMRFGHRLWIVPSWHAAPEPDAVNLLLDPGLAFGTGTHPTTALCLEWLDGQDLQDCNVLDFGCGSGILAIAALLLGARQAVGTDIDVQALEASRKAITQHWFKVFGLFLLLGLIVMVSAIPLGIGLVWSIPLMVVAMGVLYRTIFGVLPAAQ